MIDLSTAWDKLKKIGKDIEPVHLRELFGADPDRFGRYSRSLDDLVIDFSKERIDANAFDGLLELAKAAQAEARRDAMFSGEAINFTERRSVLHMALRAQKNEAYFSDGQNVVPQVHETLDRFCKFADDIRSGNVRTAVGGRFKDVVNIGIGGSDLGPVMVTRALSSYRDGGPKVHFVSNVDGAHLADVLDGLDPQNTLVLVASKTFTTQETMANARSAKSWLEASLGEKGADQHLAALSTNVKGAGEFGVEPDRVFGFWDWVGGRYSVWSAIGLSVAISIGSERFREFLAGARAMDDHFRSAPLAQNLPVVLALIGIWRRNVQNLQTVALIPYCQRLERFPAYVQQLDMESNGKSTDHDGTAIGTATGPVIWGEPGTNAQHSFFQLIHQGTDIVPVDFILTVEPESKDFRQHQMLQANCLAQSEALAFGKTGEEVSAEMRAKGVGEGEISRLAPHRTFDGNRPSTTILFDRLDPFSLGRLIALFEHKVFVQGAIWGVNSFDQWGVELGKVLTNNLLAIFDGNADPVGKDSSTRGLIKATQKDHSNL